MTTGKANRWRNLTLLVLGAGGLATWGAAACDSGDGSQDVQVGAARRRAAPRSTLEEVDQIPEGYVATPNGILLHGDCLHQIPDGAVVHADWSVSLNGAQIAQYGACTHKKYRYRHKSSELGLPGPNDTGYVFASLEYSFETMFTHMNTGYWIVPPKPVGRHGQVLYFFPALQSDTAILQPVLQWGQKCWTGGCVGNANGWTFANWWVTTSDPPNGPPAFVSISKSANAGDQFGASFDLGPVFWYLQVTDASTGTSTASSIETDSNPFHLASGGALEAYGVTTCSDFPSGTSGWTYFSKPVLYEGNNYWTRDIALNDWFSLDWTTSGYLDLGEPYCAFAGSNVDSVGNVIIDY